MADFLLSCFREGDLTAHQNASRTFTRFDNGYVCAKSCWQHQDMVGAVCC